jgi:hypothetical protein
MSKKKPTDVLNLYQVVQTLITKREADIKISPLSIANEAMTVIDEKRKGQPLTYVAAHLQLRQIARSCLRRRYSDSDKHGRTTRGFSGEKIEEEEKQFALWPELQWRYPTAASQKAEEPEYVLLDHMTEEDVLFNIKRLQKEGVTKTTHARALESWWRRKRKTAA